MANAQTGTVPDESFCYALGLRTQFRGLTERQGMVWRGVAGWADLAGRSGGDWIGLGVEALLFVMMNAETLERALTLLAMGVMAGLGLAGALYLARTPSRAVAALALAVGATFATLPSSSEALEMRRGRDVVIGAGETFDTTLVERPVDP